MSIFFKNKVHVFIKNLSYIPYISTSRCGIDVIFEKSQNYKQISKSLLFLVGLIFVSAQVNR